MTGQAPAGPGAAVSTGGPQTSTLLRVVGRAAIGGDQPSGGLDSCIITAPEQTYTVTEAGLWLLHLRPLNRLLRDVSEAAAENIGERLHHADWVLTADPAVIRAVNVHDCPSCRAGVDQALAALTEHPTVPLLAGVLYWAGGS